MTIEITSELMSLKGIVDVDVEKKIHQWSFNIPNYQRLYVWKNDQVRTLLDDLMNAFKAKIFFLGGIIVVEQHAKDGIRYFDLIDGQQRFTSLWLLCRACRVWAEENETLEKFLTITNNKEIKEPRLRFAIRTTANETLQNLALPSPTALFPEYSDKAMAPMKIAYDLMTEAMERVEVDKRSDFANFLYSQVQFAVTIVPRDTDLNKLFEVINNRGVQLQHHEILKANMFEALKDNEHQSYYALMWDVCSDMGTYIERSLGANIKDFDLDEKKNTTLNKNALILKCYNATDWSSNGGKKTAAILEQYFEACKKNPQSEQDKPGQDPNISCSTTNANDYSPQTSDQQSNLANNVATSVDRIQLADVLAKYSNDNITASPSQTPDPTDIRSIIGFPLLLQHVLRIWLKEKNNEHLPCLEANNPVDLDILKDRDLLDIFSKCFFGEKWNETNQSDEAKKIKESQVSGFLELLWKVRVIFDQFIIKWVDIGNEEVHLIRPLNYTASDKSMRRDEETEALRPFSLLQSMLYHSQDITTQYWLTPLLYYIYKKPGEKTDYSIFLRHLDNNMFGVESEVQETLIQRSRAFMDDCRTSRVSMYNTMLEKKEGLGFPHYWFYKLEYVLWYLWHTNEIKIGGNLGEFWKKYRFTSKNSIEHIASQTTSGDDPSPIKEEDGLHSFGNLALVSSSVNSGYGNRPVNEKRDKFKNKKKTSGKVESLKMDLIYETEETKWDKDAIDKHLEKMLEYFKRYNGTLDGQVEKPESQPSEQTTPQSP